jgi:hypothetical protein
VWGVGEQRAGTLYKPGRNEAKARKHLRRGWYGGKGKGSLRFEPCNVRGCWETAEREMNEWLAKDVQYNPGLAGPKGLEGKLGHVVGAERWTNSAATCLSIDDMEGGGGVHDDAEAAEAVADGQLDLDVQIAAAELGGDDNRAAEAATEAAVE